MLNELIKSVGVAGSNAAPPADYSEVQDTGYNRLVEDVQHLAAHIEGSQPCQEIVCSSSSCFLLISLSVGLNSLCCQCEHPGTCTPPYITPCKSVG